MNCLRCDPIGSIEVKIIIKDERKAIAGLLVTLIDLQGKNVCTPDESLQTLLNEKFQRHLGDVELKDGLARLVENRKSHTLRHIVFVVDDSRYSLTELIRRGLLKAHQCKSTIVTIPIARAGADFSQASQESLQEIARQVAEAIYQFFTDFPETTICEIRLLPHENENLTKGLLGSFAEHTRSRVLN